MKPLKVEFLPPRRLPAWVWYAASALLFAVAGQQGWRAWQAAQQLKATQGEIAVLQARLEQARQVQREAQERLQKEPAYAKDAAAIAKVASFPVERVFAAIESARVQGVRITALDIAPAEGSARVEIEFSDYEALARYMEALNAGEPVSRWTLVRTQSAGGGPNTASIKSSWAAP